LCIHSCINLYFFFSSRRRHTRWPRDWSSDVCSSDLLSQRPSIYNPTSMHVIIAPQDFMFGLARMCQVLAEKTKPNVVVVRTIEEAYKFLKLEKDRLRLAHEQ